MKIFTTVFAQASVLQSQSKVTADSSRVEQENHILNIYPEVTSQTILGFGGAVTESSAVVYQKMDSSAKSRFLQACFGKEGLAYTYGRCSIGSCDFSLSQYDDFKKTNSKEIDLTHDDRCILPLLRDIRAVVPLQLMMAPWSPTAAWKTNNSRIGGGKLKKEFWTSYAAFLCHYVKAYRDQGFPVPYLSIQNEPRAVQTWDSCLFSSEDEYLFLRDESLRMPWNKNHLSQDKSASL